MQVTVVTLLVTPEQSERLTLASTEGKIQLALRNPMDTETPSTPGVKPGILLGNVQPRNYVARRPAAPGQPAPAPPPPPSVEVIKGDKRSQVVVG
jgi:pilus assembly protein CpaB